MKKLKKGNKNSYRITLVSVVVYLFCLVLGIMYLHDVREIYQASVYERQEELIQQAHDLTEDFIKGLEAIVVQGARDMNYIIVDRASNYMPVLKQIRQSGNFEHVLFVKNEIVYQETGRMSGMAGQEVFDVIQEMGADSPRIIDSIWEDGKMLLLVPAPVYQGGGISGYLYAFYDCQELLNNMIYDEIVESGQLYLTIWNGILIDSRNNPYIDVDADLAANFYSQMHVLCSKSSSSKNRLQDMKNALQKSPLESTLISADSGDTCIVNAARFEEEGMYIISVSNLDRQMKGFYTFRMRAAAVLGIILLLTLILNRIVWYYMRRELNRVELMAFSDEVTKGKNVNYFRREAMRLVSEHEEQPYLIQRFDISNFRYINEAYGHHRADEILKACVELFKEFYTDWEICVRMDSDQFLALTLNDNDVEVRRKNYSERLNSFAQEVGIKYPIRLKYGIYQLRKQDNDIDVMIDRANIARRSLTSNDNESVAYYTDTIVQGMRKVDKIESEMQQALETGEFKIFLQAKWDILDDHVAGAEALVRWIRADGSMVYPDEFIPVFERNGFIEKLDFYMLETSCKLICKILAEGGRVYPISINQSRLLLHNPEYLDKVKQILNKYQVPKKYIEFEVTETAIMDDRKRMIEVLQNLKKEDIRLSMDDFGSGYSSLNILKDMPFDVLKVDREFFSESFTSESSILILQKIIEMANGLGIEVICEGVENEQQVEILRNIGCRRVQGYYYARPVPAEEYVQKYCIVTEGA